MHLTICKLKVFFSGFEKFGGEFEDFLAHNFGGFVDGIARDDRAATGERPRAPIELVGVARHDIDFIYIHAELLRDDLRKTREVTLSLRTDTRDDRDSSTAHATIPTCLPSARNFG